MSGRWLHVAVAALALTCQVAASSHSSAFHEDATSKCRDESKHFCAEIAPEEAGRCFLCQVSIGTLTSSSPALSEPFAFVETGSFVDKSASSSAGDFSPAAPRGPPFLPV